MRKTSVVTRTVRLLTVQCILIALVLAAFLGFSCITAYQDMVTNADNIIDISGKSLQSKLESADLLLERLLYRNNNYDLLRSADEAERYHASMELKELLKESSSYDSSVDEVVIAESAYQTILDYNNVRLTLREREALCRFTIGRAALGAAKSQWNVGRIDDREYVYKMFIWQGTAAAVFLSTDRFTDVLGDHSIPGMTLFLTDGDMIVWDALGKDAEQQRIGEPLPEKSTNAIQATVFEVEAGRLFLRGYVSLSEVFRQVGVSMIAVLATILILILFTAAMVKQIHRQIIAPIGDMQKSMERMQREEDAFFQIQEDYPNREFSLLRDTFNRLMDVILGLKIKSYEKQLALQETELKAVKLQIRPHFFLNAMTTISSLSQQGRNTEIVTYISALAKNIRYMFRSGLHTVPLSEEITHTENYFEMQELKYPGCVFYSIEMAPEAADWAVPQMLIHTIIENEYKYAVSVDSVLTILIKAETVPGPSGGMLRIEIEDDGKGYPEDVLKMFEVGEEQARESADGKRVGLWSLRRMLYLMYEQTGLFRIENLEPHGSKNVFLIPEKPVHEVRETAQVKID